jgi:hypothetical protein
VYLKYFFPSYRDYPLDYPDGNFEYGAVVWPMYLAERFGDSQIRRIWEAIAVVKTSGIAIFDTVIPGGLSAALNEFGVWNYFTKDRANPASFYRDGAMFKYMVGVDLQEGVHPARDSLPTRYLTSNYIEFLFVDGWNENDALEIEYTTAPGRVHANSLVFFNSPTEFRIYPIDRPETSVALRRRWSRAVLVTTCVNTVPANGAFSFTAYRQDVLAVKRKSPAALTFTGAFPNPFNTTVSIRFTLPDDGRVSVRAYDILGRKAADLFDGDLAAGEKDVLWKPENLSGGVYLVHIATPYGSHTTKILLLK